MRKLIKKILLTFFAVSFLIYLLALFGPFQRFVLNFFVKSFEKETGTHIVFSDVDGNLFHHLNFKNFKIGEISEAPEIDIYYNIFALIGKKKRISTLYAKKSVVYVDQVLKSNSSGQREEKSFIMVDSIALDSGYINYKGVNIPFSLYMKVTKHSVQIKRFSLDYPESNFIFAGDYNLDGELNFSHKFNLNLIELTKTEGNVSSEGKLEGTFKNPVGWGNISFSSQNFGKMTTLYDVKDSLLFFKNINFINKTVSLAGELKFNFIKKEGTFSFIGTAPNQKTNIEGSFDRHIVLADLHGKEIDALLECNLEDTITLNLKGKYKHSPLNVVLYYTFENLKGKISVPYFPFNELITLNQIEGNFNLNLREKPVIGDVSFDIRKIFIRALEAEGLQISSDFRNGKAILETSGLFKGKGEFELKRPVPFFFDFYAKDFNLAGLLPETTGKTSFSGKIKGELLKPQSITLSLNIENLESKIKDYSVHSPRKIYIEYSYPNLSIRPSLILVNEAEVVFNGKIPLTDNEKIDLNFSTQRLDIGIVSRFIKPYDFSGFLSAEFYLSGKRKKPEISGNAKFDSLFLYLKNDTLGPINCSAAINSDTLSISTFFARIHDITLENSDYISVIFKKDVIEFEPSKIKLSDNTISFSGKIPIPISNEVDVNISTENFSLKDLNSFIPGEIYDGNLSSNFKIGELKPFPFIWGEVKIEDLILKVKDKDTVGPLNLKMKLSGDTIRVDDLLFFVQDQTISNENTIVLNLNRDFMKVNQSMLKIGASPFVFGGKIPFGGSSAFDIYFSSNSLDLSILSPLIWESTFSGTISSSVNLKGTLTEPKLYGNLILKDNKFKIKENYSGSVNGALSFKGDIINCSDIIIGFSKGFALINGNIGFNKNASLNVELKEILIPIKKKSHLNINGNLQISGNIDNYYTSGEIKLSGVYKDPFENQLIRGLLKKANRPVSKSESILEKMKLDIVIGSALTIDNREAYIKTESDLYLSGTLGNPGASGEIKMIEGGLLNYLGTKFDIQEGIINFSDPTALKPELDLRASSEILYDGVNYLIFLNISGSPEKLIIEISSDPYMPTQEILALLITGKTRKIEPISSAQGIGMKAVNHILDITKGRVEDRLASILGFEKVTLESSTDIKIGIEKQIGKKMRVSYKTGLEDFKRPQLVIYYDVMRNISVFSIYDRENRNVEAGLDFDLKK